MALSELARRQPEIDPRDLSEGEKVRLFYAMGLLEWKNKPHQLEDYLAFRRWNVMRQLPEYQNYIEDIGALFDNLWVDECGRRYGKTAQWLIRDVEEALRRPGARGLIACAFQKNIGEIIVPLTKVLFADALEFCPEFFPKYHGTRGAEHECLVIEANDSVIKLVGVDKHPDATRGQFLDFAHLSEAAFIKGSEELVTATIMHQFQNRPWAWIGMESSTAKVPDHDFSRLFREDAIKRGAYRKHTIKDNTGLTAADIRKEERRSGGATSSVCRRELYCEQVRDLDEMIVPEFDESYHVVDPADWEAPEFALAYVGIDPGMTDPLGLTFMYAHYERGTLVIQAAWQKQNAGTGEVAQVIRNFEGKLWGTEHKQPGEKGRAMHIANAVAQGDGAVWQPPAGSTTYWDQGLRSLKPNPYLRTSDIDNRFVWDLGLDHALEVKKAQKGPGSADADLQHLRQLFQYRSKSGFPRIVILKNGLTEPLIQQLRSGTWDTDATGHRTDWVRTPALGHCDCLAALKYSCRDVVHGRDPRKPPYIDLDSSETHVPTSIRQKLKPKASAGKGAFR